MGVIAPAVPTTVKFAGIIVAEAIASLKVAVILMFRFTPVAAFAGPVPITVGGEVTLLGIPAVLAVFPPPLPHAVISGISMSTALHKLGVLFFILILVSPSLLEKP